MKNKGCYCECPLPCFNHQYRDKEREREMEQNNELFLCGRVNAKTEKQTGTTKWKGWLKEWCWWLLKFTWIFSAKPLSLSLFDTVWCQNEKQQISWKREKEWQVKGHRTLFLDPANKSTPQYKNSFFFFLIHIFTNDDTFKL